MNKPSFSFVKWLTKKDVIKILEQNGYVINEDLPNPYSKFKGDDGYYYIIVKCTKTVLSKFDEFKNKLYSHMFNGYVPEMDNISLLEFSDFMLTEFLVTINEEETIKNTKQLTANYQKYMVEKFGKFYLNMKKAYIRKLNKEIEKEEN